MPNLRCRRALPRGLALAAASTLAACSGNGQDTLAALNQYRSVTDPAVDATPAAAAFAPGQQRNVGSGGAQWYQSLPNGVSLNVTLPGDLDGDGFDDLLIWGWLMNPPDTVPCDGGCPGFSQLFLNVVYGSAAIGTQSTLTTSATITSWHVNNAQFAVGAAGDVTGDGRPDVLVSVGTDGCEQGQVFLLPGGARLSGEHDVRDVSTSLRESGGCMHYGAADGVGDLDGDHRADFAVAAPGAHRVFLYYGATGQPPARRTEADADAWFRAGDNADIGAAASVGDVDGDGRGDFVIGAGAPGGEHTYWLVRGRAERFRGEQVLDGLATRITAAGVTSLGDLDGDGRTDLAATVASGDHDAFVIAGRAAWPDTLDPRTMPGFVLRDAALANGVLATASRAGDVDGDGHADFLYGDPGHTIDGQPHGAVHLFRGPIDVAHGPLSYAQSTTFLGQNFLSVSDASERGADQLGSQVVGGSDLNGDGLSDLVFLAPGAPDGGRVYFWLGRRGS